MNRAIATATPAWVEEELAALAEAGMLRRRRAAIRHRPGRLLVDGREFVDVASNDYLGLAADERVAQAARSFLDSGPFGAGAAPLVTGYHPVHQKLEEDLADFEGADAVLLFGSGYAANVSSLSALAGPQDVIFSEKRNHASLIDGCRLSRAKVVVYRGERLDELEDHLRTAGRARRRWIVTDSVFSMEGDCAPLVQLCDLADRYGADLYLDESHATGVLGPTGRGLAERERVQDRVAIRMATLSKALGSVGGFIATSAGWRDWLLQRARGFVFSTASPPAAAAAALEALRILRREPERRTRLLELSRMLRERLASLGWDVRGSESAIIPVIVGEPERALALAEELQAAGFWTVAIRPPTVETHQCRLRLCLCAAHETPDVDGLAAAVGPQIHRMKP